MTVSFPKNAEEAEIISAAQVVHNQRRKAGIYSNFLKYVIDATAVMATALFVIPLVLTLAVLVLMDGSNPFYRQKRVGKNGRVFNMWKLRTMVPNADQHLEDYLSENPAAREEWDATQKLKNDPRITKVGRILRKTSLDELPQLWNVLRGDMSLVGPRPMMCSQRDLYPGSAYFNLRPGITGPWQISDRNDSEFKSRAIFDNQYEQAVSLKTDLSILVRTVGVVVRGTGY